MAYSNEPYIIPARMIARTPDVQSERMVVWYRIDEDGVAHGETLDISGYYVELLECWQTRDPGVAHSAMIVQGFKPERPVKDRGTFPHGMIYVRNIDADN